MDPAPLGYDTGFLSAICPLPGVDAGRESSLLPSTHFTIVFDPGRRLAAATAVNIDGSALVDLPRLDAWRLDPRVPATDQAGPALYARNDLDRGHLVRRRDPVWGPDAAQANIDTFFYTNAAPQAAVFNQGENLWAGVENHVLEYAQVHRLRLSVFTGPVFADDDPLYRGVHIPRQFWKIAAWTASENATLKAAAFLLDQTPDLDRLELEERTRTALAQDDPPPLGPFRTFEVETAEIAELTGLDLGPLVEADLYSSPPTARHQPRLVRRPLTSLHEAAITAPRTSPINPSRQDISMR